MSNLPTAKYFMLINEGQVPVEMQLTLQEWKTASGTVGDDGVDGANSVDMDGGGALGATTNRYVNFVIPAGERYEFSNIRMLVSNASETRANATFIDSHNPSTTGPSGANATFEEDTTCNNSIAVADATVTGLTVDQAGFLKAGDLITIGSETVSYTHLTLPTILLV